MCDSILQNIKKLVGIDENYNAFDLDLMIAINSAFSILNQLGVGPKKMFSISGPDETWNDFFSDDERIDLAKSYVYLKVRLLFDPPSTGVLHEAIERQISEFEWRLMIQADPASKMEDSEEPDVDEPIPDIPVEVATDHRDLTNRDAENQHPISAITDLSQQIEKIPNIMSAEEMRNILLN